jgi:predicted nuclease of predicted toxin-antitoxin system
MSLTPDWVEFLTQEGFPAAHWSRIGRGNDPDNVIFDWARRNGHVLFTHDLDFGTLLALTRAVGPSVVQLRTQDVLPGKAGRVLVSVLKEHEKVLESGAIVVVEEHRARVRILPLTP